MFFLSALAGVSDMPDFDFTSREYPQPDPLFQGYKGKTTMNPGLLLIGLLRTGDVGLWHIVITYDVVDKFICRNWTTE
jgi:hypothetical protein